MSTSHLPSYRKIWSITYPITLSLLAQNIVTVIDTAFPGRVGEVEPGIMKRATWIDIPLSYPPYKLSTLKIVKKLL